MSRSIVGVFNAFAREAVRIERAKQREIVRLQAAAARRLKADLREAKLRERSQRQDYLESRQNEALELTQAARETEQSISQLLQRAINKKPAILIPPRKTFLPQRLYNISAVPGEPTIDEFPPEPLSFFSRLLPGATRRNEARLKASKEKYDLAIVAHQQKLKEQEMQVEAFRRREAERKSEIERHNLGVDTLEKRLSQGDHSTVISVYQTLLEESLESEIDALSAEVGFAPDSRHLVVDLELPEISVIPEEQAFRYTKSTDTISSTPRPPLKRKALYANLLCQIALKAIASVYRVSPVGPIDCLTLNGMIDALDPSTGQQLRACLMSVRVTPDAFSNLVLQNVQPEQCLRALKASVSRSPSELVPVKPLIELDMVDPRFVDTTDVLSTIDQRPNLMDLTPSEFEGLITQLFGSMGLDTRQTRASRDGGVDCVAFDPRPIFGGKVVIQAKRYKNTVGVSAVRDLFGTVQNEGASKGILVTTSGYGRAAFDFAKGKPLELLDGGNLLFLLNEHAKLDARIVMPDDWNDPPIHGI